MGEGPTVIPRDSIGKGKILAGVGDLLIEALHPF